MEIKYRKESFLSLQISGQYTFPPLFSSLLLLLVSSACCPGPVPLHYPQHSPISNPYSVREPLGDCGLQTGLCSNQRIEALFQHCLWPWGSIVSDRITRRENKPEDSLSLWLTQTFHVLILSGSNHVALCRVQTPVSLPWTELRETANTATLSDSSMEEIWSEPPPVAPHPILSRVSLSLYLYVFNHTEPYGCTVCCIN